MDLDLTRVDYIQVGLTHPKCARLLPSAGIKAQQKVRIDKERVSKNDVMETNCISKCCYSPCATMFYNETRFSLVTADSWL